MKSNAEPVLYKSIVAYDGTKFLGFQRQAEGVPTVQAALETALRGLGWSESSLRAAGRTDAGVHARGQVIAFRIGWRHSPERLTAALNAGLPPELAVLGSEPAPEGFDPRFSASSRRYSYRLQIASLPDPFAERYAWRVWPAPDLQGMRQLSEAFVGRRDFGAFGHAPIPGGHTVREIYRADWSDVEGQWTFTIEADAFLNRMVRRIVGALVRVGMGREQAERVTAALEDPTQIWNGRIAPARGLCLESVRYEKRRDASAEDLSSKT